MKEVDFSFRAARREDAETVFNLTKASISGLAGASYSRNQIEKWMGERTPAFYEELIARKRMTVCRRDGDVVGFVDEPGEVTDCSSGPKPREWDLGGDCSRSE